MVQTHHYQFINGSFSFGEVFPYRVKPIDIFDGVVFFLADFRPDMQTWVVIIGNEVVDKFRSRREAVSLRIGFAVKLVNAKPLFSMNESFSLDCRSADSARWIALSISF